MRSSKKKSKRNSGEPASTFEGLRSRIQGTPIGSSADGLVQQLFAARASLSAHEIKQLESLIASRKANGELT
jgi:hypothetical protein